MNHRFRLFLCEFVSGIFSLDILTHDEYIDDENVVLTGLFVMEASKESLYIHILGIDVIDTTNEDRWFLP